MSLRGVFVVLLVSAACLMRPAAAEEATPFCRQLRAVVADAPRDFAAFRGRPVRAVPDDGGGDSAIRYAATRWLAGAAACGVDRARSDGDPIPSVYLCWFAADHVASAATAGALVHDVVDCIGRTPIDGQLVRLDEGNAAFDLHREGYVLSISAGRGHPVIFAVSGK